MREGDFYREADRAEAMRNRVVEVPIRERAPRVAVSLTARLALLEAECADFRRELHNAIQNLVPPAPFNEGSSIIACPPSEQHGLPHFEPDDPIVYAGDEND